MNRFFRHLSHPNFYIRSKIVYIGVRRFDPDVLVQIGNQFVEINCEMVVMHETKLQGSQNRKISAIRWLVMSAGTTSLQFSIHLFMHCKHWNAQHIHASSNSGWIKTNTLVHLDIDFNGYILVVHFGGAFWTQNVCKTQRPAFRI